ncbi:hypothetical protein M758_5G077300 [Ceratodon purpureus]|nr:hypothetical protein M758_5G077300 [Ceratodon purpureus]
MNKNAPQLRLSMTALQLIWKTIIIFSLWPRPTQLVVCQQSSNKTQPTIAIGEGLVAGDLNRTSWPSSPNGNFSFGFYATDGGNYKLGIWYTHVPVQTIVWGLAENVTTPLGAGAKISLTSNGSIELRSSDASQALVWSSNTDGLGVSGASFNDMGNYILLNSTSASLWQSWDSPSDTLLPGQTLPQGTTLTAMVSPHIASAGVGPYTLALKGDGNLVLQFNITTTYWSTEIAQEGASHLYFDELGDLQLLNASGVAMSYRSRDYGVGPLRRVVVTSGGNLETFGWDDTASNWTATWEAFSNECEIYGWCGRHGLCGYSETGPVCSCLPGYQAIDAKSPRQGCRLMMELNCSTGVKMVTLENTFILDYTSDFLVNSANSATCAQKCSVDTGNADTLPCLASTLENEGTAFCKLKRNQFFSAYRSPFIPSQSFVKLCVDQKVTLDSMFGDTGSVSPASTGLRVALGCVSALAGILLLLLVWPYLARCKKSTPYGLTMRLSRDRSPSPDYVPGAPVRLPYKALQKATKNFSEKLGSGGFGTVYKGVLEDGTAVAVKQLEDVFEQGEREFRTEVSVIGSTHHVNLVHLHGYCTERAHRLLVYEYLSNGSLDHYLIQGGEMTTTSSSSLSSGSTASTRPWSALDWKTSFTIALGTARGIMYLHEECRECIVHCDIKPENILLDETFCPKVSDFGLAKLLGLRSRDRHITTIRGTRGYLAPEWGANLPLTAKADVYSYGMVLLELVVGRRALDAPAGEHIRFPTWVYRGMLNGSLVKNVVRHRVDLAQFERTIRTAFWCIQDDPSARPTMGKVVQMLEGIVHVDSPPEPLTTGRL